MKLTRLSRLLPDWKNAALAIVSAVLLILAFPDFEFSFLAWFGLAPLFWSIAREKESAWRSFVLGWIWGFTFFTGTCWWLTFAPINYAGFPTVVAYLLLFCLTAFVGVSPGIFAAILSLLIRKWGAVAVLAAPILWTFSEFLRYWLTGNNWNAVGYSQFQNGSVRNAASVGGVLLVGATVVFTSSIISFAVLSYRRYMKDPKTAPLYVAAVASFIGWPLVLVSRRMSDELWKTPEVDVRLPIVGMVLGAILLPSFWVVFTTHPAPERSKSAAQIVAIQPNVPMAGLTFDKWEALRARHVELAESELKKVTVENRLPTTVIFPESPMNFMWNDDLEFQKFVRMFAAKNDVSVLFNSAEPDGENNKYFNSAVLVGPDGKEIAQYDKIYLLPFGESVPAPLQSIVPAFVGSFSYGREYDLLPIGEAKAGVMICFESHFGELGREYVRNGADVLIEMTNDGYLGPTPVLRQHLANAVFRAVETNRPVLRVTNVGITAYINERGAVLDAADSYTEASRVWPVARSDGEQTFYVKFGDWFAWLCSIFTIVLLALTLRPKRTVRNLNAHGSHAS